MMSRSDICAITCYFNPSNYISRPTNYTIFRKKLAESNIPLYVIECVFGKQKPVLDHSENYFLVRSQSILFQKERLLNLLVQKVPEKYTKIVWVDADIIFLNKNWANETSELLEDFVIVQPYEELEYLSKDQQDSTPGNIIMESYGKVYTKDPQAHLEEYNKHGHTGFAWAARRDLFNTCGIYDAAIANSGDLIFSHAATGDFHHEAILFRHKGSKNRLKYVQEWMYKAYDIIKGNLSFTPGKVLHLWHGDIKDRQYVNSHKEFNQLNFDPYVDIKISENGCWEWNSNKPELHKWLINYFARRKEDG
jgi:hypothetical protein